MERTRHELNVPPSNLRSESPAPEDPGKLARLSTEVLFVLLGFLLLCLVVVLTYQLLPIVFG